MTNGGIIGSSNDPEFTGTPGVWSLDEAYQAARDNKWPSINHVISAPGSSATTITSGGKTYKVHSFTAPGSIVVTALGYGVPNTLEYLVVAGGGSGNWATFPVYGAFEGAGGGGGAGGMRTGSVTLAAGTFPVTVGAAGNPSTLSASPAPVVSTRGGPGGAYPGTNPGTPGGSGGGGGSTPGPTVPGGSGTSGQGYPGGSGDSPNTTGSGGGGGAGGAGQAYNAGKNGGPGANSSITGTSTLYAVGGGGYNASPRSPAYGSGGTSRPGQTTGQSGIIIVRYEVV